MKRRQRQPRIPGENDRLPLARSAAACRGITLYSHNNDSADALSARIKQWGEALGFQQVGVTGIDLAEAEQRLASWLAADHHGPMGRMARDGHKRSRPESLVPDTRSVISVRLDYMPEHHSAAWQQLRRAGGAYISRYALGRDYHRVLRRRLQRLALRLQEEVGPYGYRVFCDSAPVLEKPLARNAGLGWIGKHTNLINRRAGSWFFLGEIYTDLPLQADRPATDHCGSCSACIDVCPTRAIVAPYQLDARRCISYLTIEHPGSIPESLRPALGNRIYGCDDCQLVCPWNKYAQVPGAEEFSDRLGLAEASLVGLMNWDETVFSRRLEGSAIRRIGHERWQRNIAVALGNCPPGDPTVLSCLQSHRDSPSALVREHVAWALERQHRAI